MAIALPQQIFNQFKGIREINGVNSGGQISALSAVNVEFFNSDIGNGVGIRTVETSQLFKSLPTGYKAIKVFVSNQDGVDYLLIYGENAEQGVLYYVDGAGIIQTIVDDLSVTGQANGLTMQYGQYDVFIFTNGTDKYSVCFAQNPIYQEITAEDNQGRTINWLSMTEWNGFLVVASDYGVHSSHKNDIYTWDDVVDDVADSWYIDFGKKVTAVAAFATGLFIFTEDDISHLNTTPNDAENALLSSVAMNGCFSYESLVAHGTYLFFYDDKQKNIFYIMQTDTGQTRPTGPVAQEIQSYFNGTVERCKLYSCIYSTKNEIWMILNDKVLIFDYFQQEFVERKQSSINSICKYNNKIYSAGDSGQIRVEKQNGYNSWYEPCEYRTCIINMGSNTNLKKQKTPILLVLNENYTNDFFVEITADYKEKNPKKIVVKVENQGMWAGADDELDQYNQWGVSFWCDENPYKKRVMEISTPQTWYNISLRIYTEEAGQGFSIESIELKRLKEKTKTKGR